jgi:centromeric protein E
VCASSQASPFESSPFTVGRPPSPLQGKTHTLSGYSGDLGIIPRAISHLFEFLQSTTSIEYLVRVSYVEIYNEEIRDLLEPMNTDLRIFDDPILGEWPSGVPTWHST